MKQPPKLATWLLIRLGCSPENEAILGDLYERYQTHSSPAWYWRQVFVAILESFFKEAWQRRNGSVSTIAVGLSVLAGTWFVLESLAAPQFNWSRHACTFMWFISGSMSGAAVRLVQGYGSRLTVVVYAASVFLGVVIMHSILGIHHSSIFWIDTLVLTSSILLAAAFRESPTHYPMSVSEENAP